jgi:hypothetical protein
VNENKTSGGTALFIAGRTSITLWGFDPNKIMKKPQ